MTAKAPGPNGAASNAATFVVVGAAPAISSLSPASVTAGSAAQVLTVNGSNFAIGAQVLWDGSPLATEVLSPTQLRVQLPAALLANALEQHLIVVVGLDPGKFPCQHSQLWYRLERAGVDQPVKKFGTR